MASCWSNINYVYIDKRFRNKKDTTNTRSQERDKPRKQISSSVGAIFKNTLRYNDTVEIGLCILIKPTPLRNVAKIRRVDLIYERRRVSHYVSYYGEGAHSNCSSFIFSLDG